MPGFDYIALDPAGKQIHGVVMSDSHREAVRKVIGLGHHPISVSTQKDSKSSGGGTLLGLFRRIKMVELAVFTRQLSSLLKAGLPMVQALGTLQKQCSNTRLATVVGEIEDVLRRDGGTLSQALERYPHIFSPVYRGLVRSGEEGGKLVEVLSSLAVHLSQGAKIRGQVLGAFIYPIFLLVLGVGAVGVLMVYVIPKFKELFDSFGQDLPWPTRVLIDTSDFISTWWWAIAMLILSAVIAAVIAYRNLAFKRMVHGWLLRLPIFGAMFMKVEIARMSHTLSALLHSGIRILDALLVTGNTITNLSIRACFPAIIKDVSGGETIAGSMSRHPHFPHLMINMVRTGEDTGELPEMLSELSTIYEEEADRAVNGAVKLLEPLLIVIMGGAIALIVAAVILPLFRANAIVAE